MSDNRKPGSDEAIAAGCTCPAFHNDGGKGVDLGDLGTAFCVNEFCPLHGKQGKVTT